MEEDVISRDHGGRSRRRNPTDWLTPEELNRANEEARRWRASLRNGEPVDKPPPQALAPPSRAFQPARQPDEAERRARFAEAIARAEFGRFYRNGRGERDAGAKRRRKPDGVGHTPR
jgi:hypothetical protein